MAEEQQRERADPISRLFALITMKLENAAGIAADCQGRRSQELWQDAENLGTLITKAGMTVAVAIALASAAL